MFYVEWNYNGIMKVASERMVREVFFEDWRKRILTENRRKRVAACVLFDVTPYKEMRRDAEQFLVRIRVATVGGGVRNPDAGLAAKVRAPGGVVLTELAAEMVDVGGVRKVDVLGTASVVAPHGRAGRSTRLSLLLWSASANLGWGFLGLEAIIRQFPPNLVAEAAPLVWILSWDRWSCSFGHLALMSSLLWLRCLAEHPNLITESGEGSWKRHRVDCGVTKGKQGKLVKLRIRIRAS
ncbi:hypothetical protein U1Q18_000890 [Sarracenia purpurea var. burkii]